MNETHCEQLLSIWHFIALVASIPQNLHRLKIAVSSQMVEVMVQLFAVIPWCTMAIVVQDPDACLFLSLFGHNHWGMFSYFFGVFE